MMKQIGFLSIFSIMLLGCNDNTAVDANHATTEAELSQDKNPIHDSQGQEVSKATFDGDWPLAVDHGFINCQEQAASFTTDDGTVYALNGFGRVYSDNKGLGWQPITPESRIWLDNPDIPGAKISISNLASAAMALCEE